MRQLHKDMLGIAQTGTGKTLGYMMPILDELKYSKQSNPRILILVPTRELVIQVKEEIDNFSKYLSVRTIGIYGGVNIKRQVSTNIPWRSLTALASWKWWN